MGTHAQCENPLGMLLGSASCSVSEQSSPLVIRKDGVRFSRAVILGAALCLPFWALVFWAIARLF